MPTMAAALITVEAMRALRAGCGRRARPVSGFTGRVVEPAVGAGRRACSAARRALTSFVSMPSSCDPNLNERWEVDMNTVRVRGG